MNYKVLKQTDKVCTDVTTSTESILTPMWCKNLGNNMEYIKKYGSISKLLCGSYPVCWKLDKLRNIFQSSIEYEVEQVSKECQISEEIVKNSVHMCLSDNNYAGTDICEGCKNKISANKSALIIAGGPSLDTHKHLDLLKKYGFKGDIFCVTSVLKKLLDKDIIPNYIHSLDAEEYDTQFIDDKRIHNHYDKITGIFGTTVHPTTNEVFKGNRLFYSAYVEDVSHIFNLITNTPQVPACGNVGSTTIVLASILEYNPIILIGMDLSWESFDDMKEYYRTNYHSWNPNPLPIKWTKKNHKKHINPIYNKPYYIDTVYEAYKISTTEVIKNIGITNIKIINCTEQGALHSKDIKNMKFEDYLKSQKDT